LRVALVCDWLTGLREPERVLRALCEIWPEAPVYTAVYNAWAFVASWRPTEVRTSFLQRWPGAVRHPEWFWPLLPLAFEELDLRGFDVVISSHHTAAQGVIVDADALHLAYVHAPVSTGFYAQPSARWRKASRAPLLNYFRAWDVAASLRVEHHITHSGLGAARVARNWRRRATVLPPPIRLAECPLPGTHPREAHVLLVPCGLSSDARARWCQAVEASGAAVQVLPEPLALNWHEAMARAAAVCVPKPEYAVSLGLEALACGTPLLLARTGNSDIAPFSDEVALFFDPEEPAALAGALEALRERPFDPAHLRTWAEKFTEPNFAAQIKGLVESLYQQYQAGVSSTDFALPAGAGWNANPFQEASCFNPLP